MKFTCEKNALVSAVSVASRTVAQKSTIPALEGIYIRAGVKLTLSGYNLETGITISVDAEIQQTGACIMPSRLFFDIIRKLPDDTVSISVDEKFKSIHPRRHFLVHHHGYVLRGLPGTAGSRVRQRHQPAAE